MFTIGTSIEIKAIKKIFKHPKQISTGLITQIIIFPLIAFFIASISGLRPEYQVGIVILAACPGGTLSNFITYLIKGDTPLSVSLTSVNGLITLITIPIYAKLAMMFFMNNMVTISLPIIKIMTEVFTLTIIPISIGITLSHYHSKKIDKAEKILRIFSSILLAAVFIIKFLDSRLDSSFISSFKNILTWTVLLNATGLFLGYLIAKLMKFSNKTSVTFGVEIGLQNTVLALLATDVIIGIPLMGEPALIYAMFSFWTTFLFGIIFKKRMKIKHIEKQINKLD
jgi:BASS family bile acid:Na+ symporter